MFRRQHSVNMVVSSFASQPPAHLQLGQNGEDIAVAYLLRRGYRIEQRNVRLARCEIDIVAFDPANDMLVFAEVKTRARASASYPIRTAMDGRKRRAMHAAVDRWVAKHDYDGAGRIDLLCVCGGKVVEHIHDVGSDYLTDQ